MTKKIIDIYCPNCNGPTKFDIVKQCYFCNYCGSNVQIDEAIKQKQGFRKLQSDKLKDQVKNYKLFSGKCSGCDAQIVFEENEATANCPFCGKSMLRSEYLSIDNMPESIIPFSIKLDEAKDILNNWCKTNSNKQEAKRILKVIDKLQGFYLPYELVKGPVHLGASRMDRYRKYECEGFIEDEFVNRSSQLDNLLLDGMEPFNIEGLTEFDFGYVTGQIVKISDINDQALKDRVSKETSKLFTPSISKVLQTKAIDIDSDVNDLIRLPVLLPVYYICEDDLMVAINGQTGKLSVKALKDSYYYFLPWWFKAILATLVSSLIVFAGFVLFGMDKIQALYITGMLAIVLIIILLCFYSDTVHNKFKVVSGRKIYTSKENTFKRQYGQLVLSDEILNRKIQEPVFFEKIEGEYKPVVLKFVTIKRVLSIILTTLIVLFLPVILALFINGFDFSKIVLGGSAVWFCIVVPVLPAYLLKFAIVGIHDDPWIYLIQENGKTKKYKKKIDFGLVKTFLKEFFKALFIPPLCFAIWFGIISFLVIIYITAGY